jgi:uncharacterized protein with PQ loop repeat
MDNLTILGLLAGFITTSGLVPQVIKGYRSGSMDDVSLLMPLVLMRGWPYGGYGVLLGDSHHFLERVGVSLNAILIALKIRSIKKERGGAPDHPLTLENGQTEMHLPQAISGLLPSPISLAS